jgi:hypothetical protein
MPSPTDFRLTRGGIGTEAVQQAIAVGHVGES